MRNKADSRTQTEARDFSDWLFQSCDLLDEAIDWIRDHLSPQDVFSDDDLTEWAKANYECDSDHVEDEP